MDSKMEKLMMTTVYVLSLFMAVLNAIIFTDENQSRNINAISAGLGLQFEGNISVLDHFKLLERDGDFLLIGARDIVYNLSMNNFIAQTPFIWRSTEDDVDLCTMKGKSKEDCHNYIRILAKQNDKELLICGTNSYMPKCRKYKFQNDTFVVDGTEFSGTGLCPYDPGHNSTAYYSKDRNELYAGTVADFVGTDPLVSRRKMDEPDDLGLRTERSDTKCLNDPNFVSSFADKDHVYFWFREGAVEHMNCGKAIYSRVARVCKNDKGGPRANADSWTTFLKAKLNCSIPGDYPFYFDEIEATSALSQDNSDSELVYAVFSTPYNAIRASAICAFNMNTIRKIFSQSAYKAQNSPSANWLPILRSQVPQPRPGDCDSDSRYLSEEAVNFVKKNPLMDEVVPNHFSAPLHIETGFKRGSRFTHIVVHSQLPVVGSGSRKVDVIFVGTDDGHFKKLVNVADGQQVKTVVIETVHVFADHAPIKNMLIYHPTASTDHDSRLIVVSDELIKSLPLYYCNRSTTCNQCLKLQDPYCAWDISSQKCIGSSNGDWSHGSFIQSLHDGDPKECSNENILEIATKHISNENNSPEPLMNDGESKFASAHTNSDSQIESTNRKDKITSFNGRKISCDCSNNLRTSLKLALVNEPENQADYETKLASNMASNPGQPVSSRSSERQEANSAPIQTSSFSTIQLAIVLSIVSGGVMFLLGICCERYICPKYIYPNICIKKIRKIQKIPSKNAVYPNDDIKNRSIHGSSSPLNSDLRFPPILEVSLNLDEGQSIRSPASSQNSAKYSNTLPKEFKVKRTYL